MKLGFLLGKSITLGGLVQFAGPFGNRACFDKEMLKSPLEILCHASPLMIFWAGLYNEMDRDQLVEGANLMLKVRQGSPCQADGNACKSAAASRWAGRGRRRGLCWRRSLKDG